jgi:hypothetical protein
MKRVNQGAKRRTGEKPWSYLSYKPYRSYPCPAFQRLSLSHSDTPRARIEEENDDEDEYED